MSPRRPDGVPAAPGRQVPGPSTPIFICKPECALFPDLRRRGSAAFIVRRVLPNQAPSGFETVPLFSYLYRYEFTHYGNHPPLRPLRAPAAPHGGRAGHLRLDRHPTPPPGPLAPVRGRHAPDRADPAGGGRNACRHGQSGLHAPQRQRLCGTDRLQIGRRR